MCDCPEDEGKEQEEDETHQGTDKLLAEAAEFVHTHKIIQKKYVFLFYQNCFKKAYFVE